MNKKQLINEITEHFPSVYTKEDVVKLINMLDEQSTIDVEDLKSKIRSKIERLSGEDIVNYDDVELSMSYGREITVDDVPVNHDTILDEINEVIDEMFVHDEE